MASIVTLEKLGQIWSTGTGCPGERWRPRPWKCLKTHRCGTEGLDLGTLTVQCKWWDSVILMVFSSQVILWFILIFVVFQQICRVSEHISALVVVWRNNNCFRLGHSNSWEIFFLSNKSTACILYCSLQQRPNVYLPWKCGAVTIVCVLCSKGSWHWWCAQTKARWWTQGEWSQAPPRWFSSKDSQGNSMESDNEACVPSQKLKETSPGLPVVSICWSLNLIPCVKESNCRIW